MKPSNIIPIGAFPSRTHDGGINGIEYFDPDVFLHSEFLEFHRNFRKAITDRPRTASTSVSGRISKTPVRPRKKADQLVARNPIEDRNKESLEK